MTDKKRRLMNVVPWTLDFLIGAQARREARPWKRRFKDPGRNAPCPCGSGKKYKACHATQESREEVAKRHGINLEDPGGDMYVQK